MIVRTHKKQDGITKDQVLAMHAAHPEWNASRIARELKCVSGYVRATLKRAGEKNPGHRPPAKKKFSRIRVVAIDGRGPGAITAAADAMKSLNRQTQRNAQPYWNRD
jgi:hypothetical protein